jgi:hypothetical protein
MVFFDVSSLLSTSEGVDDEPSIEAVCYKLIVRKCMKAAVLYLICTVERDTFKRDSSKELFANLISRCERMLVH